MNQTGLKSFIFVPEFQFDLQHMHLKSLRSEAEFS